MGNTLISRTLEWVRMLRTEIIAQIDAEIGRLSRARDILASAPIIRREKAPSKKAKKRAFEPKVKQSKSAPVPRPSSPEGREIPASSPPPLETGPIVQLVPPKRRIERQKLQRAVSSEMLAKSRTALSGVLPAGPVAVSAHEARKAEARSVTPPVTQIESEVVLNTSSERSLGTLLRAFERSSRLNIGTS
jgi:hypothetical protein